MKYAVEITVDPELIARQMTYEDATEFITTIDAIMADYDFTLELMKRLSSGMEKEADEYAHVFKQITELLSSIK